MKPTYLVVSTNVFKDPSTKGARHFHVHEYSNSEYEAVQLARDLAGKDKVPGEYYVIQHIRTISSMQEVRIVESWDVPEVPDTPAGDAE